MTSTTRLRVSCVMLVLSAIYAVLLANDPDLASAVAVGYIALLVTMFAAVNVWKKP